MTATPKIDVGDECPVAGCTGELIQAGITEVVSLPFKAVPSRWKVSIETARALLTEAGMSYREIAHPNPAERA